MTRVQWLGYVVPGGAAVDVVADDRTTTPTLSIESPSDLPSGGPVTVYSLTTVLTNDEIKALPTTAVELVPAPGTDMILRIEGIRFTATTITPYTNVNADGVLTIALGEGAEVAWIPNDSSIPWTFLTQALADGKNTEPIFAYEATHANWGAMPQILDSEDIVDTAVLLSIANAGAGDLTGGNAGNTLRATVFYMILDA